MKYQNSADAAQAPDDTSDVAGGPRLSDANINPATGLATDYLNRFSEAVMLLDMLSSCPEFRADFLAWKPMSYREHFRASHFKTRDLAIAAYDTADPDVRNSLDTLAVTMTIVLEATRAAMDDATGGRTRSRHLPETPSTWLKPLDCARRRGDQRRGRWHRARHRRRPSSTG